MKKIAFFVSFALLAAGVSAAETDSAEGSDTQKKQAPLVAEVRPEKASWPVWLSFNDSTDFDIIGLRFNLPAGDSEGLSGFDLGIVGRLRYLEGVQLNILRNDVSDSAAGFQVGIYNSVGSGLMTGVQIGLWNEAHSFQGIQLGLVNVSENGSGFQVGIINRCSTIEGFQIGGINIIRESDLVFMPLLNASIGD